MIRALRRLRCLDASGGAAVRVTFRFAPASLLQEAA